MLFNTKKRKRILLFALIGWGILLLLIPLSYSFDLGANVLDADSYSPKNAQEKELKDISFYFSGDEISPLAVILQAINNAEEKIVMAMYSYTHPQVHDALNAAQARGVDVQVLVDEKRHQSSMAKLQNPAYSLAHTNSANDKDLMHHKFLIIDDKTLLVGSLNLTPAQIDHDPSLLMKITEKQVIERYNEEWNRLKKDKRGTKKLRERGFQPFMEEYNDAEVWFGPGFRDHSYKTRLIDAIKEAKSHIRVIGWQITDKDIAYALNAKLKEGVRVQILLDDFFFDNEDSVIRYLISSPHLELITDMASTFAYAQKNPREEYFNPYLHQHTLIIDEKLVATGTANWSYAGFYRNDEAGFVFTNLNAVKYFLTSFNALYDNYRKENAGVELRIEQKKYAINIPQRYTGKTIKIYKEGEQQEALPPLCLSQIIKDNEIEVPEECHDSRFWHVYILDKKNELLASQVLQK